MFSVYYFWISDYQQGNISWILASGRGICAVAEQEDIAVVAF